MEKIIFELSVFFENPFWIGLYERKYNNNYEVCKITFGAEPKIYEVYDFMLRKSNMLQFSPSLEAQMTVEKRVNPKRMQREINKQREHIGMGTKAQQALKLQQEEGKLKRKYHSHIKQELEKERLFQLKQTKRKEKHRGH